MVRAGLRTVRETGGKAGPEVVEDSEVSVVTGHRPERIFAERGFELLDDDGAGEPFGGPLR